MLRLVALLVVSLIGFAAGSANAAAIRIAVGCPAVDACGDWHWAQDFAAKLKEKGIEADAVLGGALGPDQAVFDQMSQGLVEVGLTNFVMVRKFDPLILGFFTPYVFDDLEHMFRAIAKTDLQARMDKSVSAQHVRLSAILGVGGPVGIFNTKRDVHRPADLAGLRFRAIDKSQLALYEAWGTQGVVVDMPEVATALQSGVIDGYINPPAVALIFHHTDFFKFYTDAKAGIGVRVALMSRDWYDGLDAKAKAAVNEAEAYATEKNREWTLRIAAGEIKALEEKGVKVTSLTADEKKDFATRSQKAWTTLMPKEALDVVQAAADKTRQ